jgi:hypothetical protein
MIDIGIAVDDENVQSVPAAGPHLLPRRGEERAEIARAGASAPAELNELHGEPTVRGRGACGKRNRGDHKKATQTSQVPVMRIEAVSRTQNAVPDTIYYFFEFLYRARSVFK